ncbi:RNA polymerase I-specific transcription initiation factor RRN3 [Dendrothele bispora CBS 962.96]|uniref:RNA polymerase I-specific transcription initiation factor RRN3 n=1 Tax=Dendrothele bispora (strain CBS 962.96) TaxID=1314807 RepID=A0A4S8MY86_DENBC|nr:RNA polymerase I-specific transcription initiation factor RRN3 [Dendrothele bispora CBS 962.96]
MDPHSRLSQFDKRTPRSGPQTQNLRFMDPQQSRPSLHNFKQARKTSSGHHDASTSLLIRRPIATNSRIKQEEKTRKDMFLAFVNDALQQKSDGNSEAFDELVNEFNPKRSSAEMPTPQPTQLRLWIQALSHVVSRLERTHSALVEAIVSMPWVTLDTASVKSYTVFIGMLVSARPEYLSIVLSKIAHGFTYQASLQALDISRPETSSSPLTRRVVYDRVHFLLRHLLSLIPTLSSTLMPLLSRNFPHKRQNILYQSTYIRNLLRVSGYCPELSDQILSTIVDRAIQIDVEIQVELEELEDVEDEQNDQEQLFELDPFDIVVGQEGSDSSEDEDDSDEEDNFSDLSSDAGLEDMDKKVPELPMDIAHIREMVKKLDTILKLMFDHFQHMHRSLVPSDSTFSPDTQNSSPPPELPPLPDFDFALGNQPPPGNQAMLYRPSTPATPTISVVGTPTTPSSKKLPSNVSRNTLSLQFHALLSIFDRTILRTFKSRYTQFLLFWYTSLDPEYADIFQGMLVDRALFQPTNTTETPTPVVTRAAAASYLGSFVSRAQFVDREGTRRVVSVLCQWLQVHLDGVDNVLAANGGNVNLANMSASTASVLGAQNTVFYAVSQALFLIFCFRWRDLLENEENLDEGIDSDFFGASTKFGANSRKGKKWMKELDVVQRVVNSVLNPLKVCSPNVAMQFARVAQATDFIYCYTILESNRRSEYTASSGTDAGSRQSSIHLAVLGEGLNNELNTFFPFDPYKLPKSGTYIQDVYRDWTSVAIDDEDEEDEEEEEEEEEEEDEKDGIPLMTVTSVVSEDQETKGLGASFDAMSISPARPGVLAVAEVFGAPGI